MCDIIFIFIRFKKISDCEKLKITLKSTINKLFGKQKPISQYDNDHINQMITNTGSIICSTPTVSKFPEGKLVLILTLDP